MKKIPPLAVLAWSVLSSTEPHHCHMANANAPLPSNTGEAAYVLLCSTAPIYQIGLNGKPVTDAFENTHKEAIETYVNTMNKKHAADPGVTEKPGKLKKRAI